MTEKRTNVTPIHPGRTPPPKPDELEPSWLTAANKLHDDVGKPPAVTVSDLEQVAKLGEQLGIDESMKRHPSAKAQQFYEEVSSEVAARTAEAKPKEPEGPKGLRADTPGVQLAVVIGVALIGLAAFAISYGAVYEVAGWTGWANWQMILTPLLFDAGIVVFTFLSFIRGERGQSTAPTYALAEGLSVASAAIQVIHTLTTSPESGVQLLVACIISALPPLILSAASYLMGKTIFSVK